jgi:hypothetical protein
MAGLVTRRSTGTQRTVSGGSSGRSSGGSTPKRRDPYFPVCVDNRGYEAPLVLGKIYQVIMPERNGGPQDVRVIDEDGEDDLYSSEQFVPVDLPARARKAVREAVRSE